MDTPDTPRALEDHVVLIGWDAFTIQIVEQLLAAHNVVAIALERGDQVVEVDELFGQGAVHAHVGRYTDLKTFAPLRIDLCRKVFVNLPSDHESLIAVLSIRALHPDAEVDVVLSNEELRDTFYVAGVTYAVSPHNIASRVVASYVHEEDVGRFTSEILSATRARDDCEMQQYRVLPGHDFDGRPYDEVFWALREGFGAALLGVARDGARGARDLRKLPGPDETVRAGDALVLLVRGDRESELTEMFGVREGVARDFDS